MHYLLYYGKAPDHAARQAPFQAAHLEHLQAAADRGALLLGGNVGSAADGEAVLLFQADSPAAVEAVAAADPFVVQGIVARWRVRPWDTVTGAALPER